MENVTVKFVNVLSKNNQVIVLTNGLKMLNNYGVNVAEKMPDGKIRLDERYWDYSLTTSKGRCEFLNEKKTETEKKIESGEYILTDLNN